MKGLWIPSDERKPAQIHGPHVDRILTALKRKDETGLSNAEIDSLLGTASQWLIFWEMRELLAAGLVKYEVQPFGEAGRYRLTEKGLRFAERLST